MILVWKGEELRSPSAYGRALAGLENAEEGARLVALMHTVHGDVGVRQLAYALGELETREQGARAREFTGLEHPIIGDLWPGITPVELFELGAVFAQGQIEGLGFAAAAEKAHGAVHALRQIRRAT